MNNKGNNTIHSLLKQIKYDLTTHLSHRNLKRPNYDTSPQAFFNRLKTEDFFLRFDYILEIPFWARK